MELPSTEDFYIDKHEDMYGIFSTHTDVCEHKDSCLSRCYKALVLMQAEFEKMVEDIEANKKATAARGRLKGVK